MATLRFSVAEADAGSRLDRALASRPEIGARSLAERLLADGAVTVDGAARPKSHRLEAGSVVEVELPDAAPGLSSEPVTVGIAYEDEHLVVVDKPAGITVHPGAGTATGTLAAQLADARSSRRRRSRSSRNRPPARPRHVGPPRRRALGGRVRHAEGGDPDAGGRAPLPRARARVVRGRGRGGSTRRSAVTGAIRRSARSTPRSRATAITWFEVVETLPEHALLDVRLETGRTHQIRVHLAAIDLPVSGDPSYGVKGDLGLERQFLHAHRLRFVHPVTGAEIDLESPLPDDLAAALERARAAK